MTELNQPLPASMELDHGTGLSLSLSLSLSVSLSICLSVCVPCFVSSMALAVIIRNVYLT